MNSRAYHLVNCFFSFFVKEKFVWFIENNKATS